MNTTANSPARPRCSLLHALLIALAVAVLAVVGIGGWMAYVGISVSLRAEKNLHATLFTIRLVEQFVADHGRWPGSWAELEGVPVSGDAPSPMQGEITVLRIGGQHGFEWPAASAEIQQCVAIDFGADPAAIAEQDRMNFTAIRPIGPYYEYRYYGFVDSLQETIRMSVKPLDVPAAGGDEGS